MIVCQCKGVTDRQIRALVRRGCGTIPEIGRACGAGTDCAGCLQTIQSVIAREQLLIQCEAGEQLRPSREVALTGKP
jgi:bacterioferritin-associated ferredoxin